MYKTRNGALVLATAGRIIKTILMLCKQKTCNEKNILIRNHFSFQSLRQAIVVAIDGKKIAYNWEPKVRTIRCAMDARSNSSPRRLTSGKHFKAGISLESPFTKIPEAFKE
jgi:hypothetical protein